MIVLSEGEKWYSEPLTHHEPMRLDEFEKYYRDCPETCYDPIKMEKVEHYSADVCYSYCPLYPNNNCFPINQTDYKIVLCFSLTREISIKAKYKAGEQRSIYVYLTTKEVQTLYKDPKSIWDKSQEWVGDVND